MIKNHCAGAKYSLRRRVDAAKGFTLLEALLAAAVVGIVGYVLVVSFNNGQMALLNWELNNEVAQFKNWAVDQIDFESMDLDTLEEGDDDISAPNDAYSMRWYAYAQPTRVLDVFEVELHCEISGSGGFYQEYVERTIVTNPNFYEDEDYRERLAEEKQEFFEDLQEARERL